MNILLVAINAKYIHSNLAVYSLKSYAVEYQEHIRIAEYTINHQIEYILQQIYKQEPDVLCFSCYIWNFRYVQELITELHKLRPHLPIWAGGPEVSYEPELFLERNPGVTGVMLGEGEGTFRELCGFYLASGNIMQWQHKCLEKEMTRGRRQSMDDAKGYCRASFPGWDRKIGKNRSKGAPAHGCASFLLWGPGEFCT